jgi:hypothetical protein
LQAKNLYINLKRSCRYILSCIVMLTLLVSLTVSAAQSNWEHTVGVAIGSDIARVGWNIAGDSQGNNPNIISELTWTNVKFKTTQVIYNKVYYRTLIIMRTIAVQNFRAQ